jgi:hypothetical protein
MSKKFSVFTADTAVRTRTAAQLAEADSRIRISRSDDANYASQVKTGLMRSLSPGQSQTLIKTDDEVVQIENNQLTKAVGQIVMKSENEHIHIKAATDITLEVGNSKLIMRADGTIQLIGIKVFVEGDSILSQATTQHTIIGGRVDINP